MSRRIIEDAKVVHIWEGYTECDESYETEVGPEWYADNGTPIDGQGDDMRYIRTEIIE